MAHRSFSGPPEVTSPPLSPLCPWIHGLFPAIEFVVAPSSLLPNSGDPRATLAHVCLHSGNLTATERSDAACSHLFSLGLITPSVRFRSNGPDRRILLRARAPDTPWPACQCHSQSLIIPGLISLRPILIERLRPARTPLRPILIERFGPIRTPPPSDLDRTFWNPSDPCSRPFARGARPARSARSPPLSLTLSSLLVSARLPARAPSSVDLTSAVCFRSDS
jgi:hypothetical protein